MDWLKKPLHATNIWTGMSQNVQQRILTNNLCLKHVEKTTTLKWFVNMNYSDKTLMLGWLNWPQIEIKHLYARW